jgi:hypothetical protein
MNLKYLDVIVHQHHQNAVVVEMTDGDDEYVYDDDEDQPVLFVQL